MQANTKESFLKPRISPKLNRTNWMLRCSILVMGVIVIYNSFIYLIPLYYMLYFLLGRILGIVYRIVFSIGRQDEKFEIKANQWSILFSAALILLQSRWGQRMLEGMNVLHAKDALSLLFIGMYITKLKIIWHEIDDIIFSYLYEKGKTR